MNIQGLQKMTLLDFPGKVACTVFTGGCNFRCPFCHNAGLVLPQQMSSSDITTEDVFSYLKKRKGILDGVCITGGEPLLQKDIEEFITEIKTLGFLVKLDTNGSFPDALQNLLQKKLLDYVAMDIKNCKEKYAQTVGCEHIDLAAVCKSMDILKNSNIPYEFRTTVVKEFHSTQDLVNLAKWIFGTKNYFLQSFTDSGNLISEGLHGYDEADLKAILEKIRAILPSAEIRGL